MKELVLELIKLIFYSFIIVCISKYILVNLLRKISETFNLKPKTTGKIAGISTSIPELLTISFSSASGLIGASIFNVLSSNIINFLQYIFSIVINKNVKVLKNKALKIDLFLVCLTIIIPIIFIKLNITSSINIVPLLILLMLVFLYIDNNAHKLYLKKEEKKVYKEIAEETRWLKGKKRKTLLYTLALIATSISLYIIGNLLGDSLEMLCLEFNVSQNILGIFLGIITSIPELITFFESQKHHKKEKNNQAGVIEATNNLLSSNILCLFVIQSFGIIIYYFSGI